MTMTTTLPLSHKFKKFAAQIDVTNPNNIISLQVLNDGNPKVMRLFTFDDPRDFPIELKKKMGVFSGRCNQGRFVVGIQSYKGVQCANFQLDMLGKTRNMMLPLALHRQFVDEVLPELMKQEMGIELPRQITREECLNALDWLTKQHDEFCYHQPAFEEMKRLLLNSTKKQ